MTTIYTDRLRTKDNGLNAVADCGDVNVIFDCDDVLLDWQTAFRRWLKTSQNIQVNPVGPRSWDMDQWIGQPAAPLVERFNETPAFGNLQAKAGAKSTVHKLFAKGCNIHVVSSCATHKTDIQRRKRNLLREFGSVFASVNILPLGASKMPVLSEINPGIYVEDNVSHAVVGALLGHETFILRMSHNLHLERVATKMPRIHWVDEFQSILDHITHSSQNNTTEVSF